MPSVASDRLYLVAASGLDAFRPVFDGLTGVNVYNLNPDAMTLHQPAFAALVDVHQAQRVRSFAHVVGCVGRLLRRT